MSDTRATDLLDEVRAALADRYEVVRQVGQGGMATVYLARDRTRERDVAVKVLRPELAASIGADRFIREIQVASQLNHPHILGLYDSGEIGSLLYFTMPFVVGESLRDRLERETQLPVADALDITRQVASALEYAHQQGVVHRDIKPENILLSEGTALVADFGIARAVTAAGGEKLTQTGIVVGTPVYMSPEQSSGDKIDGRADEYSLACVLYEMLVGNPPFSGSTPVTLMARHSLETVPSAQLVRGTIPDVVEDVMMRALAKAPADRYSTARAMAAALDGAEQMPATGRHRTGRRQPRRNQLLRLAAAAAVAVAALAGWRLMSRRSLPGPTGPDPSHLAVLYFADRSPGHNQEFLTDGLTEALIHELSQVSALSVISRNGTIPYRGVAIAPDSIARALKVGTLVQGTVTPLPGDSILVDVSLMDGSGREVASKPIKRPHMELFALQADIAKEVAVFLRRRIGVQVQLQQSRAGTANVQAWELEQRADQVGRDLDPLIAANDMDAVARQLARADSLHAEVAALDPRWVVPVVQRGWLAYRHSRLSGTFDKGFYSEWTERGLGFAEQALAISPTDADALELRGTLRYWRWLLNLAPTTAAADTLLAGAESDLRAAVAANSSQASAWATLSHLLLARSETAEGKLAAQNAYEADPYLSSASVIVWRLFASSLDLDDRDAATRWCAEGQRRFPDDPRFAECQIWLYSLKGQPPDVPRAWRLLAEYVRLSPPNLRPFRTLRGQMIVAMAIARAARSDSSGRSAALADSARAVAVRARADGSADPTRELSYLEAVSRTILGDRGEALRLLSQFYAANPQQRASAARDQSWQFAPLHDDPRYKALSGGR